MKTQLLKPFTALAVVALSFGSIHATDDFLDDDDCQRGGQVEGTEELEQEICLKPTEAAPQGARGRAELEVENENGVTSGTLETKAKGLLVGTYTVTAISLSSGTPTQLGTFEVTQRDDGDDDDQGEDNDDQGDDRFSQSSGLQAFDDDDDDDNEHHHGGCENRTFGEGEFGDGTSLPFPEGFNPLDIAKIEIADANGVIVLIGDFTNPSKSRRCHLDSKVVVTAGAAAPGADGSAALRVKA